MLDYICVLFNFSGIFKFSSHVMVIKLCDGNDVSAAVMMHNIYISLCTLEIIIVDTIIIIGVAIGNCLVGAFVYFTA